VRLAKAEQLQAMRNDLNKIVLTQAEKVSL
jgi:hypothetical protein